MNNNKAIVLDYLEGLDINELITIILELNNEFDLKHWAESIQNEKNGQYAEKEKEKTE